MRASTDSRHRLYVQAAIDYIAERLGEPVRLEDLARHIGLSPAYLQRVFRAQVGESPAVYARLPASASWGPTTKRTMPTIISGTGRSP